jgi:hypothetical protein
LKGDVCPSSFCIAIPMKGDVMSIFRLYCNTHDGRCISILLFPKHIAFSLLLLFCKNKNRLMSHLDVYLTLNINLWMPEPIFLPAALCPGFYSASNINEYQKQRSNVSGE